MLKQCQRYTDIVDPTLRYYTCPVCRHYIPVRKAKTLKTEYESKKDIEKILSEVLFGFSGEAISKIADVAFKEQARDKEG